jgi:hypothetical protein
LEIINYLKCIFFVSLLEIERRNFFIYNYSNYLKNNLLKQIQKIENNENKKIQIFEKTIFKHFSLFLNNLNENKIEKKNLFENINFNNEIIKNDKENIKNENNEIIKNENENIKNENNVQNIKDNIKNDDIKDKEISCFCHINFLSKIYPKYKILNNKQLIFNMEEKNVKDINLVIVSYIKKFENNFKNIINFETILEKIEKEEKIINIENQQFDIQNFDEKKSNENEIEDYNLYKFLDIEFFKKFYLEKNLETRDNISNISSSGIKVKDNIFENNENENENSTFDIEYNDLIGKFLI